MTPAPADWPAKRREMHNHHMDSTRWNGFPYRDDDVIVATWAKSGTTWTQQIITQLIFEGREDVVAHEIAPWLDMRIMPWPETLQALEAQTHRRVIKTHLPVDALGLSPLARYIYVARDARDIAWSMHNHHRAFNQGFLDELNAVPGRVGPPLEPTTLDARDYYNLWIEADGAPFWPFWSHIQSWWDVRHLPNVMLVHFAGLKADMAGEARRIAEFLGIEVSPEVWARVLEHSSFDWMKANAERLVPMLDGAMEGGARSFINRGENRRWAEVLSPAEIARCDEIAAANLTPDCAHWLRTGELPAD